MNPTALFGGVDRERAFHEGQIRQLNQRRSPLELAHGLALVTGFGGGLFAAVAAAHRLLSDADQLAAIALRAGILTMLMAAGVAVITGRALARIDRRIRPHAQRIQALAVPPDRMRPVNGWPIPQATPEQGGDEHDAR